MFGKEKATKQRKNNRLKNKENKRWAKCALQLTLSFNQILDALGKESVFYMTAAG